MKFSAQREDIHQAVAAVQRATATRVIQPILSNILIESLDSDTLKLSATDLDFAIETTIPAKILEEGFALRAEAISRPILLVTDDEHGLDGGGVINFIEVDRNLRFEISLNAADRSGLKINSALLSVAARVERRPLGALSCPDGYLHRQLPGGCDIRIAGVNARRGA